MTSALDITESVKPPRAVFVNFPLGHQTGRPGQPDLQRAIIRDAFRALETMTEPGTAVTLPYVWNPGWSLWCAPPELRRATLHRLSGLVRGVHGTSSFTTQRYGAWEDREYRRGYLRPFVRRGQWVRT